MSASGSVVRCHIARRILTELFENHTIPPDDQRLLRSFAESSEEEDMTLDSLAHLIVRRESRRLEIVRPETGDLPVI